MHNEENKQIKILLDNISHYYITEDKERVEALSSITASITDGEFVSIIGPSGCGKTTILNILAGLVVPSSGKILLDNKEVIGPGSDRGMVFQQDAILLWRKVLANVEYGLELKGYPKEERKKIALKYLTLVGLEKFKDLYPKELSGGMRKRVQIAAVFANDPDVLLMDEPFGPLDYPTKCSLQNEILKMWTEFKKTVVFVTHDVEEALFLSDRIFVIIDGRLVDIIKAPFPRPRRNELRINKNFSELKMELFNRIEVKRIIEQSEEKI